MATLEIRGLRKRFGALEILKGIDISLEKGGFLVLVGPSGCGKSTLLNTIAGLESSLGGRDSHRRARRQRSAPFAARHRDGVSILCALSQHVGGREHRLRHGDAQGAEARTRQGGGCGCEDFADRASVEAPAGPAFRRPTPARGDGAGAGASTEHLPVRRTAVQPRRQAARRHAHRDQAAASDNRRHHRLCHA